MKRATKSRTYRAHRDTKSTTLGPKDQRRTHIQSRMDTATEGLRTSVCTPYDLPKDHPLQPNDRCAYLLKIVFDPVNGKFTKAMEQMIAGKVLTLHKEIDGLAAGMRVIQYVAIPKGNRSKRDLEEFRNVTPFPVRHRTRPVVQPVAPVEEQFTYDPVPEPTLWQRIKAWF